jgi:guanylate kinase
MNNQGNPVSGNFHDGEVRKISGGRYIIVSAPSGAGKTTIVRHLLSLPLGLRFSVSATSRAPREGEIDGRDYFFLHENAFREKIAGNAFVEWEEVYPGVFYGTLESEIRKILDEGFSVIFDVDVVGGLNLKKIFGEQALAIFIRPPSVDVLRERLRARSTESESKIATRIAKAEYELSFSTGFDKVLVNDKLDETLKEAEKIVSDFLKGTNPFEPSKIAKDRDRKES